MFHYEDFGPMIYTAREDLGMTRKALAALAAISLEALVTLEDGEPGPMTVAELLRILHHVGLDVKVFPIPGPRPTYDDLTGNTLVRDRELMFQDWIATASEESPPSDD